MKSVELHFYILHNFMGIWSNKLIKACSIPKSKEDGCQVFGCTFVEHEGEMLDSSVKSN